MPRNDPYKNFRFRLEIDGIQSGFREATIADSSVDVVDYRNGDEPPMLRKSSGLVKYGNLTLKWGITGSLDLYNWHKAIEDGGIGDNRKNVAVVLLNDVGEDAARWEFQEAWPAKYDAPDLNAISNEIGIESLEIVHEGMRRTK